jgi:hypothetical protein
VLQYIKDGFFDELLSIFELKSTVGAILIGLFRGMHAVIYGVYNSLNNFHNFQNTVQSSLSRMVFFHYLFLFRVFNLLSLIHIDLFLLLPKLLINKFLQILMYLLNHDYSFEYGSSLLRHEVRDEFKLALDSTEIATLEFEGDDPVGDYFVEGGLLPDLVVECLVIPEAVAEHLEERNHPQRLYLLEVHEFVKEGEEDGSVNYLGIADDNLIEHP